MKDFLNTEKSEKLKEVLLSISGSQSYFEKQGVLIKTFKSLEDIYWQGKGSDQYRHLYSDLFVIITHIDRSTELDNEILAQNLLIVCKNYRSKNKDKDGDTIDITKSLFKLYDHVNLDIARLNYSKASNFKQHEEIKEVAERLQVTENGIQNKLNEAIFSVKAEYHGEMQKATQKINTDINKQLRRVAEETSKMRAEYISILGIFASIVLAFVGGLAFSNSVLSNIHKASIYRTVIVTALIGMVLIFVLWLLMDFIKSVHGQDERRYSFIIVPELVLLLIIIGTIGLFRWDYFYQEKAYSIYESNTEGNANSEIQIDLESVSGNEEMESIEDS